MQSMKDAEAAVRTLLEQECQPGVDRGTRPAQ